MAGPITPADLRRGLLAHLAGEAAEAESQYRRAMQDPALAPLAQRRLTQLLESQHRWEEAVVECRGLLARNPAAPEVRTHLGALLLGLGRYDEGWPLYEARAALDAGKVRPRSAPYPEWDGGPVNSLVVWDEQGFGDAIQFARFIPQLVARGVRTTFVARTELVELFSGLGATVLAAEGRPMEVPVADAWAMVGSLPGHLRVTPETLPGRWPYLAAPDDRRAKWAARLSGARIGVAARGKPGHANDRDRSLPATGQDFLRSLPGAVSLSPGEGLPLEDFSDTAAVIDALDLVISVDTAVAHLAGAMGKPCWLLLPYLGLDWRWMHERADTPWYPSLKLYRQPRAGDWASVLRTIAADLPGFFGQA